MITSRREPEVNEKINMDAWAKVLEKLPKAEAEGIVRHLEVAADLIKSATRAAEGWKAKAEEAKRQGDMATKALGVVSEELGAWRTWAKATHEGNQAAIDAAAKAIETTGKATYAMLLEVYGGKLP